MIYYFVLSITWPFILCNLIYPNVMMQSNNIKNRQTEKTDWQTYTHGHKDTDKQEYWQNALFVSVGSGTKYISVIWLRYLRNMRVSFISERAYLRRKAACNRQCEYGGCLGKENLCWRVCYCYRVGSLSNI